MTTRTAVVGGGSMGVGIAHALAESGAEVALVDADLEHAVAAREKVAAVYAAAVGRGKMSPDAAAIATARIHPVASIDALPSRLELIVEAVPERLELKRSVLGLCATRSPAVLATNTSGLSIDALSSALPNPEGFIGLHFFNPVWAVPFVEIVMGQRTADETRREALAICAQLRKETVVVRDSPGFASSRLGLALGLEAMRMLEERVATALDIDRAMELGYRHPMGPLRLTDLIGLDVRLDIARSLEVALGPRFTPPRILVALVEAGDLGKKTGRGFYDWTSGTPVARALEP
ncbi:MAG TPA: 3-hydroxyacyl-CoA dehydrogenase family protein [Candidatus Acidoferrales bacterium]|nr:3-hydroxyacyl-CoA dehydrogenase family protein [Candidatus Acidoferrales bacterium]